MASLARHVTFTLHPHANADTLSIARIDGTEWQCVVRTSDWSSAPYLAGIYLALDSLCDVAQPWFAFLRPSKAFPDGRPGHRVRTVRLRGALSQGLVIPCPPQCAQLVGDDLAWALGVERYEPPIPVGMAGDQIRCPAAFAAFTKIENAKNFPAMFAEGEPVVVTEKIHGTNFRVGLVGDGGEGRTYIVGSHATARATDGTNLYSDTARAVMPEDTFRRAAAAIAPGRDVIVYGEIFGHKVQDLAYGCKANERRVRLFGVSVDGVYQPWGTVAAVAEHFGIETVPVLYRGPFERGIVEHLRDGESTIPGANHVREGVVVTAHPERHIVSDEYNGRAILKYISDAYLLRSGEKDGH